MIYLKNVDTDKIISFENEDAIGMQFQSNEWVLLSNEENAVIVLAKDNKKKEISELYKISKIECKFILNGEIIPFLNGVEDCITELNRICALDIETVPQLGDMTMKNVKLLYKNALAMRSYIRNNVEIVCGEIMTLSTIDEIMDYESQIQITFPSALTVINVLDFGN